MKLADGTTARKGTRVIVWHRPKEWLGFEGTITALHPGRVCSVEVTLDNGEIRRMPPEGLTLP